MKNLIIFAIFASITVLGATPPSWWFTRGVVDDQAQKNDNGPANLGQLKWMATKAKAEVDAKVIDGFAGPSDIFQLPNFAALGNKAPVTLGQAKTIAKLFYDRFHGMNDQYVKRQLNAIGYPDDFWDSDPPGSTPYPWTASGSDDENYALLTIGQLKTLFCFHVDHDTDGDGINDLNEGTLNMDFEDPDEDNNNRLDGYDDFDLDGYHNSMEIEYGTNPNDSSESPDPRASLSFEVYSPLQPTDN